MDEIDGEK